jgi:hypothetical protein
MVASMAFDAVAMLVATMSSSFQVRGLLQLHQHHSFQFSHFLFQCFNGLLLFIPFLSHIF